MKRKNPFDNGIIYFNNFLRDRSIFSPSSPSLQGMEYKRVLENGGIDVAFNEALSLSSVVIRGRPFTSLLYTGEFGEQKNIITVDSPNILKSFEEISNYFLQSVQEEKTIDDLIKHPSSMIIEEGKPLEESGHLLDRFLGNGYFFLSNKGSSKEPAYKNPGVIECIVYKDASILPEKSGDGVVNKVGYRGRNSEIITSGSDKGFYESLSKLNDKLKQSL